MVPQQHERTTDKEQQLKRQNKTTSHRPNAAALQNVGFGAFVSILLLLTTSAQSVLSPQDSTYYYVGCFTERTDLLKETIYAKTPQSCVEICEHQTYSYAILSAERCFCANSFISADRQDEQLCNTRCLSNKAQYCGGIGVHSYYSTLLAKEPAPNHLKILNATEHSLTLTWEAYEPRKMFVGVGGAEVPSTQQITNFLIKSHVVRTYSSQAALFAQPEFIVQSTETRFEITDLHPATEYNVSVEAMCASIVCGSASLRGITEVGQPDPEPRQPRVLTSTSDTITIEIPPIRNDNGPVSQLLIIVERVDAALSQPFDIELLGSWQKSQDDGLPYYIAAELDYPAEDQTTINRTRKFIVGDGKRYGRFTNPPLDNKEAHIHVSLGVVSTLNGVTKTIYTRSNHDQHTISVDNFSYATFDTGHESVIALIVTCTIFGTCLVLSLITYFYLRYKTYTARSGASRLRNAHEMSIQQPIIERENNGFVVEDDLPTAENFKQQLNALLDGLEASKRLHRNALRMNVNDVIAEGRYGEVITGKVIASTATPEAAANADCQLHVLALDDMSSNDQAHLLRDFRNLTQLQRHDNILDFYGVSASADWFYFIFEHQTVSLKRRLIESRRAPNSAPVQRITALSEELVLQWIYEVASALEYLSRCKVVHKQLCSHSIFVTAETKLKLTVFGPTPYAAPNNQKKVDLSRWLAPEALRYQHYSTKSDVWSFACVAWECCALGGTPYANITNVQHLLDAIKSGSRPAQPAYIYQDLYQLLLNCWQLEPSDRINFEEIAFNVRQLMTSPRHALCFDRLPETAGNNVLDTLPYYLPMLEMQN